MYKLIAKVFQGFFTKKETPADLLNVYRLADRAMEAIFEGDVRNATLFAEIAGKAYGASENRGNQYRIPVALSISESLLKAFENGFALATATSVCQQERVGCELGELVLA